MNRKEYRATVEYELYGEKKPSLLNRIRIKYFQPSTNCVYLARKMWFLHEAGGVLRSIAKLYYLKIWRKYGCCIYPYAEVGKGFRIEHPVGIVMGKCCVGTNFTLFQNTTIGTKHKGDEGKGLYPKIGNDVTLYSGSMILGNVTICDGTIVGANSVLTKSTDGAGIYVGNPAKKVEKAYKMAQSDYLERSRTYKGYHYSVLDPKALDYLHQRTLEMFQQVKRIFEENNIRYMICGGTLLGAIGGGGIGRFIPWDDDFDVCIFEEDYDRAIECLTDKEKGLSEGAVLQCVKTDPNYYLGWMKIRDQRSHTYPDAPRFKENGVWIDLYKIVKSKAKDVPVLIAEEAIHYLDRRLAAGGLTRREYDIRISDGQLRVKLEEAKQRRNEEYESGQNNDRNVYVIWSASKVVLEEEWVEPLRTVTFEGVEVTTFCKAEEYLKQHYGENYKELPPDELRRVGLTNIEW